MKRYISLLYYFTRTSLIREIGFKANFVTNIFVEIAWSFVTIFGLEVMFFHTDTISGWSKGEVFLIYALYRLMSAIFALVFRKNVRLLPQLVNTGELDIHLSRPVNSCFYLSTRIIAIDRLSQIIIGIALLTYASILIPLPLGPATLLLIFVMSLTGSLLRYSVSLMLHSLAFWLQKLQNLERLELVVFGAARFPRQAFPPLFSQAFTYLVPVFVVAAIPSEIILHRLSNWVILGVIAASLISVYLAYLFFNYALSHYSSASS